MKVLFVAEDYPYPPDSGGRLRTSNLLKHLSLWHEITLIAPVEAGANLDPAYQHGLKRIIEVPSVRQTAIRSLISLVSQQPYVVCKYRNLAMNSAVADALDTGSFDLLHCDSAMVAHAIPADVSIPKVLNMHSIEALVWERYLSTERTAWMIPVLLSQLRKIVAYESKLPEVFDWCLTVSDKDREEMRMRYQSDKISVIPNGVDIDYFRPLPDPLNPTIAFIGSLDYRPNKDAIRWFVESIWTRVRAEMPEAKMLLVGRRPPRWMADLCQRADISLHSDVPDTRPYLAEASLVVSPIRIAGGTRLKILEAMAAGRCVVSTTIGAEGLDVRDEKHLVIADEPADFAQKVIYLLRDPIRRHELACEGRALVEANYVWDHIATLMNNAWSHAAEQVR